MLVLEHGLLGGHINQHRLHELTLLSEVLHCRHLFKAVVDDVDLLPFHQRLYSVPVHLLHLAYISLDLFHGLI